MDCERCGQNVDTHPTVDVSNTDRLALCQERAIKWQRVEPGTVIPAGQPYRVEYASIGNGTPSADERVAAITHAHTPLNTETWFVDSTWTPPLVLPTEPTWGIAVWRGNREDEIVNSAAIHEYAVENALVDFIPLTDEQVARIEAAR